MGRSVLRTSSSTACKNWIFSDKLGDSKYSELADFWEPQIQVYFSLPVSWIWLSVQITLSTGYNSKCTLGNKYVARHFVESPPTPHFNVYHHVWELRAENSLEVTAPATRPPLACTSRMGNIDRSPWCQNSDPHFRCIVLRSHRRFREQGSKKKTLKKSVGRSISFFLHSDNCVTIAAPSRKKTPRNDKTIGSSNTLYRF